MPGEIFTISGNLVFIKKKETYPAEIEILKEKIILVKTLTNKIFKSLFYLLPVLLIVMYKMKAVRLNPTW